MSSVRGNLVHKTWQWNPTLYAPARYRRGCEYDAFIPEPLLGFDPSLSGTVAGTVSDAEKAISELNRASGNALDPLARLLLRTESIASSRVEGMQVDARSLARAEATQDAGRSIGLDAAEILANVDAMQLAIERASSSRDIHVDDIIDIHKALMATAPNREVAGRIRETQNWIGGNNYNPCEAAFVPPPSEHVSGLLDDLTEFCNDEGLPPLVQAAIAHAQFETIHPFEDGNGRTGRALVQIIFRRRGLAPTFVPPVSIILAREKERYINGLTLFREDHIDEWLEIFAVAASRAAGLAKRYTGRVADLQDSWRERLRLATNPRADAAAWAIIDLLPAHPILTVPVAVAVTKRTKPAVANGIDELERVGVLNRVSQSIRNRAWEAEGLLDLVVGLESGLD
jgi:Fic family protein